MSDWHDRLTVCEIQVATDVGQLTVTAFKLGWVAAHRSLDSDGWTVTHLEHGLAIPIKFPTLDDAAAFVERVSAARNCWSFESKDDPAFCELRDFCRSDPAWKWRSGRPVGPVNVFREDPLNEVSA